MIELTELDLRINYINDISPLTELTYLNVLYLRANDISDISPLSGLTNLIQLGLEHNSIDDITALSGLVNLVELDLSWNDIRDISPLVDNRGIGNSTHVDITENPLDCDDPITRDSISVLEERGVRLVHECVYTGNGVS